jgi:pimeloyl-ACP methyl ester carboxylesterase
MACLPEIARSLADAGNYDHRRIADSTHFLQLERPEACATVVREFLHEHP